MPTICVNSTESNNPVIVTESSNKLQTNDSIQSNVTDNKQSPNHSIKSQNISITTLDDNDETSSVAESDLEYDAVISDDEDDGQQHIIQRDGQEVVLVNSHSDSGDQSVLAATSNAALRPNIGSIAVQNSSDITFGNKTFYQGPVTIKQFISDNNNKWRPTGQANDNPNFSDSNRDLSKNHGELPQKDASKRPAWLPNKRPVLFTLLLSILALVIASFTLTAVFFRDDATDLSGGNTNHIGDGDDYRPNIPINSSIGDDILTDGSNSLRLVARDEWLAQPPENTLTDLELPATRVIIAHSATENCTTQAMCTFRTRIIQTYHMESRGWDDIGYNFLVGGDGNGYEGRGWNKQGAHTKGFNTKSICIAFIGTFNKIIPPNRQLRAAQQIIEMGLKLKKLDPNFRLYGHRQLMASESPGTALYEIITKWPNWSDNL